MHRVALVIHHAKLIEDLLRNGFYAEGKGLVDMALFLQKVLPHELLTEIRQIAHQRNHFAHEVNPNSQFNLFEYIRRCSEVELRLMDMAMNVDLMRLRTQIPHYSHPSLQQRLNHDVEAFEKLRKIRTEVNQKRAVLESAMRREERLQSELAGLMTRLAENQANNHQLEKTVSDLHRLDMLEKELAEKNRVIAELQKSGGKTRGRPKAPAPKPPRAKATPAVKQKPGRGRPAKAGKPVAAKAKRSPGRPPKKTGRR